MKNITLKLSRRGIFSWARYNKTYFFRLIRKYKFGSFAIDKEFANSYALKMSFHKLLGGDVKLGDI